MHNDPFGNTNSVTVAHWLSGCISSSHTNTRWSTWPVWRFIRCQQCTKVNNTMRQDFTTMESYHTTFTLSSNATIDRLTVKHSHYIIARIFNGLSALPNEVTLCWGKSWTRFNFFCQKTPLFSPEPSTLASPLQWLASPIEMNKDSHLTLSLWTLHVLPVFAWVSSMWFWFSPSPKDINFGCTGENENAFQCQYECWPQEE